MPEGAREGAERKVKQRTLGNIRLIAQLYKQDVVSEKILHACIQEMLGDGKSEPFEEDVEAREPLLIRPHLHPLGYIAMHPARCMLAQPRRGGRSERISVQSCMEGAAGSVTRFFILLKMG
jgi:hypothetical protein